MSSRHCRACNGWHDLNDDWPIECLGHFKSHYTGNELGINIQVVRDTPAYRSMIDGSVIDGRKRHRDHLRAHNCIEVGNDTSHLKPRTQQKVDPSRKESLHRMLSDVSEKQLQSAIKTEIRNRK